MFPGKTTFLIDSHFYNKKLDFTSQEQAEKET